VSANGNTIENPLHRLTPQQLEELAEEFQKIHDDVFADLGDRDARYIRGIIDAHRRLAAMSRIFLMASRYPPALVLGTIGLSTAKILENMEIGHNVRLKPERPLSSGNAM
jgi:linoleoyl-CoA desaturase